MSLCNIKYIPHKLFKNGCILVFTGHQLTVFNSQAQIQVGGKWNRAKQRVERAFSGVMSGLVFNGLRLLDLAAEHDPRTEVRGDVTFLTSMRDRLHDPLQRMQQVIKIIKITSIKLL